MRPKGPPLPSPLVPRRRGRCSPCPGLWVSKREIVREIPCPALSSNGGEGEVLLCRREPIEATPAEFRFGHRSRVSEFVRGLNRSGDSILRRLYLRRVGAACL